MAPAGDRQLILWRILERELRGDNSSDYGEQITSQKAVNRTGELLLFAGDLYDNANFCMTMQLVNTLIEADRLFDMLIMNTRNHDLSYDTYYLHRLFEYLEEGLVERLDDGTGTVFVPIFLV
jgi:hypothetical protein